MKKPLKINFEFSWNFREITWIIEKNRKKLILNFHGIFVKSLGLLEKTVKSSFRIFMEFSWNDMDWSDFYQKNYPIVILTITSIICGLIFLFLGIYFYCCCRSKRGRFDFTNPQISLNTLFVKYYLDVFDFTPAPSRTLSTKQVIAVLY